MQRQFLKFPTAKCHTNRQRKCHHDTQSFWWWCQTITKSLNHSKTNENGFGAGNRNSSHRSPNPKILYHIFQPHERLFLQTWWADIHNKINTVSQNGNGCTTEQGNYGQNEEKRENLSQQQKQEATGEHRWEEEQAERTLTTGYTCTWHPRTCQQKIKHI